MKVSRLLSALFVVYAVIALMLIATLMPPFQAADELAHAERADQIGFGEMIARRFGGATTAGGIAYSGLLALAMPFDPIRFRPSVKVDPSMRMAASTTRWGDPSIQAFPNTAIYPPTFYIPATMGLASGHALRLSVLQSMVLSRLLTGLVSVAIAGLAILLSDAAAPFLFAVCCLPMSLALFAAISQDGPMIACAVLGSVLLGRPTLMQKGFWLGCILVAAVTMARPAYLPLCLIPMLSPTRSWTHRLSGTGIIGLATFGWVALSDRFVIPNTATQHIAQQVAAIRHHPHVLIQLVHTTLNKQLVEGLPVGRELIGVLGWLDTTLPNPYYVLAGVMLLLAMAMSRSPVQRSSTAHRQLGAAAALSIVVAAVCAVYVTQYLSWSQIGSPFIDGVQGRYFLPLAPFLIFVLPEKGRTLPRLVAASVCIFPVLSIALTVRSILVRYYLG